MKILITGIAGFLGSHLASRFLADGHEVVGVDSLIGGDLDNVPTGAECYVFDLNERNRLELVMREFYPDVVYHAACTPYEGLSVFSPHLVTQNTSGITASVVSASIATGVKRIVYCSSMARYGAQRPPFHEGMQPRPVDPYGIAKVASEELVKCLASVHGYEWVIAVPHNIIGPRQRYVDPFRNVAAIMINCMLQGKQPVIYGDGSHVRCFSPIQDVVDILARLITEGTGRYGVWNVGPDRGAVTILQLAETIARLLHFDLRPRFLPERPLEVAHATCSSDAIRRFFGYEERVSLEDSLQEMIDFIKQKGPAPFLYHLPLEIVTKNMPATWRERSF